MRPAFLFLLRLITGRTRPARFRIAELHREMGLRADGGPGGFWIEGGHDVTFVNCASAGAIPDYVPPEWN